MVKESEGGFRCLGWLRQGCCAETGKFQYDVNSVYFCQFQYFFMPFDALKSV